MPWSHSPYTGWFISGYHPANRHWSFLLNVKRVESIHFHLLHRDRVSAGRRNGCGRCGRPASNIGQRPYGRTLAHPTYFKNNLYRQSSKVKSHYVRINCHFYLIIYWIICTLIDSSQRFIRSKRYYEKIFLVVYFFLLKDTDELNLNLQ